MHFSVQRLVAWWHSGVVALLWCAVAHRIAHAARLSSRLLACLLSCLLCLLLLLACLPPLRHLRVMLVRLMSLCVRQAAVPRVAVRSLACRLPRRVALSRL